VIGGREGIDLSVGALISLGAVISGNVMNGQDSGIVPAILLTGVVTFLIGIVSG
jgi:ribose transport system permease protein